MEHQSSFHNCLISSLTDEIEEADQMSEIWAINNFPTPPYDYEAMSNSSPTGSNFRRVAGNVDSDSLFGELSGVNFADAFDKSCKSTNLPTIEACDPEDQELLNSFVKEIDELGLEQELKLPTDTVVDPVIVEQNICENSEENILDLSENSKENQADTCLSFEGDDSESDSDDYGSSVSFRPIARPPPNRQSKGKLGPDESRSPPAIQMVKVSQYKQYSFKEDQHKTDENRVLREKKHVVETKAPVKSYPTTKKYGNIDPLNCDIRKIHPNRKAAVQAKINREKKKLYIHSLEEERDQLLQENEQLSSRNERLEREKRQLTEEVAYLRRVLVNDSALSGLLQNIGSSTAAESVSISGTILRQSITSVPSSPTSLKRQRSNDVEAEVVVYHIDHDYTAKRAKVDQSNVAPVTGSGNGICLHVDRGNVSIELCRHCANKSQQSISAEN